MTSLEFAQYLATQPWGAMYYQNLSKDLNDPIPIRKGTIISGAFSWQKTPQGLYYWSDISNTVKLNVDDTWPNLRATLTDYFFNHPEFLI